MTTACLSENRKAVSTFGYKMRMDGTKCSIKHDSYNNPGQFLYLRNMDDSLFKSSFRATEVPHWPCPACDRGILRLKNEDFFSEYDAATDALKNDPQFDHEWVTYVFHGFLRCNLCLAKVAFSGDGFVEQDYDDSSERGWSYFNYFRPKYFHPPLLLIQVENKGLVPQSVMEPLQKACELFWADLDSCSNRIRTAVEYILDDLKVPRRQQRPKRRLNLHERINLLQQPHLADVKTILEAVKWIGNSGTHELGKLGRQQVVEGFRMLEHCLSTLYPKPPASAASILAVARAVNDAKGSLTSGEIRRLRAIADSGQGGN